MNRQLPATALAALRRAWHRAQFFADLAGIARLLKYRRLRERYYRALWEEAAATVGATLTRTPHGYLRIDRGRVSTFVRQSLVMLDDHLTLQLMGDKALTFSLLEELGAPVPRHCVFSIDQMAPARHFLAGLGAAAAVKPASGTGGGRGVTTGVADVKALARAARRAARHDDRLLVEEMVAGDSYRLLYLDGRLIDCVRRDPPHVRGDGKSTIRRLVALENARREAGPPFRAMNPLTIDSDCRIWLAERGMSPASIPALGQYVQVKRAVNENDCFGNVPVLDRVGPDIAARCGAIVRRLGVRLAGVDLYCRDISGRFVPENCVIGEINTTPAFHHHDLVSDVDAAVPVAAIVLEYMLSSGEGAMLLGKRDNSAGETKNFVTQTCQSERAQKAMPPFRAGETKNHAHAAHS